MLKMVPLLLLIIVIHLHSFPLSSTAITVNVTTSLQLVKHLCYTALQDDLHLVLSKPSFNVTVNKPFCDVHGNGSLLITSTSSDAVIHCKSMIGFSFIGISFIKIQGVTFRKCGSQLHKLSSHLLSIINNTELSYYLNHSVALLFINSQVSISGTILHDSVGFAMIGVNPFHFHVLHTVVSGSSKANIGSGLFLHFFDQENKVTYNSIKVLIMHCCFTKLHYNNTNPNHPLAANGITVVYAQRHFVVNATIKHSKFESNCGSSSVLMKLQNANASSFFHVIKSDIHRYCYGSGGLVFKSVMNQPLSNATSAPLMIEKTSFKSHVRNVAISIDIVTNMPMNITLTNLFFFNNTAENGPCILFNASNSTSMVDILLFNVYAAKNSLSFFTGYSPKLTGLFYFSRMSRIRVSSSRFFLNYGSVFAVSGGAVLITGNVTFLQNVAQSGAALFLLDTELTLLDASVIFANNRAIKSGGAIYAHNMDKKLFSIHKNGTKNNVIFIDNIAFMSGNSIYAYPSGINKYWQTFTFNGRINNTLHLVSTAPVKLVSCVPEQYQQVYAGQKFTLHLKALDQWNRSVFSPVTITAAKIDPSTNYLLSSDWHIPVPDYHQMIEERSDDTCTALNLTLLSKDNDDQKGVMLVLSPFNVNFMHKIILKPCPFGFENKDHESCQCDTLIAASSRCDISNQTVTSYDIHWIGNYTNGTISVLAYSKYCPITYCNSPNPFRETTIKVTDTNEFKIVTTDGAIKDICEGNRGGVLCGKCVNGTSLVLGPDKCHVCNNWWLLSLLLYAIAGPLFIYLLHALKLTITTGTLNGIIFYAQAANCGLLDFMVYPTYYHDGILALFAKIATAFLAFLNLQNGYPFCLYNGMTMIAKGFFSLLFILYLLLLVLLIIILSRYSTRLSNYIANSSVQVLVTVVHLSFYKLMDAVIKVFLSTEVYFKNFGAIHVWSLDGSVVYFSKEHVTLMIFTFVIVMALLLPYIVILLGGRLLLKYCDKLRPVYEAIHGPYKEKNNYWFTARLLLLIAINIIYISLRSINIKFIVLFTGVLLILFTVAQAHIKPFKNKFINMLDLFVMVLFLFQYIFSLYAIVNEHTSWYYTWALIVSALLLFIIFIGVIIGHALWVTGKYQILLYFLMPNCAVTSSQRQVSQTANGNELNSSYYGSCNCREPVLSM